MKCPACTSEEPRVMTTRPGPKKIVRLRACVACGHRWTTAEIDSTSLNQMEIAANTVRSLFTLSKELGDATSAHG